MDGMEYLEPQILEANIQITTNFEQLKEQLAARTEKYRNLLVTDENLADMERVRREIVSMRTFVEKFEREKKAELRKPIEQFSKQCRELIDIITEVEIPIAEQLRQYENRRKEEVQEQIHREFCSKCEAAGLREEFRILDPDSRWLNKTAKWSQTCIDLDHQVAAQLALQQQHDDRAEILESKRELADEYIQKMNEQYGLHDVIQPEFLGDDVLISLSVSDLKEAIREEAERRQVIETSIKEKLEVSTESAIPVAPTLPPPPIQARSEFPKNMAVVFTITNEEDVRAVEAFVQKALAELTHIAVRTEC